MDYDRLLKNILDVIEEEQVKLGYRSERIRLYYPLRSLNRFLGSRLHAEEMLSALEGFRREKRPILGDVDISCEGKRFCFDIPPEGADYVHAHLAPDAFIVELVGAVASHGTSIQDVLDIFRRHGRLHVEKMEGEDFDMLAYFEDGVPDTFRYCLTDEGGHVIYHRYTEDDYKDIMDTGNASTSK